MHEFYSITVMHRLKKNYSATFIMQNDSFLFQVEIKQHSMDVGVVSKEITYININV